VVDTIKISEEDANLDGGPENVRLQPSELIADPIAFQGYCSLTHFV
jgi:hypothetical protein